MGDYKEVRAALRRAFNKIRRADNKLMLISISHLRRRMII
jgi:hypothetical protein